MNWEKIPKAKKDLFLAAVLEQASRPMSAEEEENYQKWLVEYRERTK